MGGFVSRVCLFFWSPLHSLLAPVERKPNVFLAFRIGGSNFHSELCRAQQIFMSRDSTLEHYQVPLKHLHVTMDTFYLDEKYGLDLRAQLQDHILRNPPPHMRLWSTKVANWGNNILCFVFEPHDRYANFRFTIGQILRQSQYTSNFKNWSRPHVTLFNCKKQHSLANAWSKRSQISRLNEVGGSQLVSSIELCVLNTHNEYGSYYRTIFSIPITSIY